MQYFYDQKQIEQYYYRRDLRKTSNSLGVLLIIFLAGELVFSVVLSVIAVINKTTDNLLSSTVEKMLDNAVFSLVVFFFLGIIYALFKNISFDELFPFKKAGTSFTFMMIVIGLTVALLSNYAADLIGYLLGSFGKESVYSEETGAKTAVEIIMSYVTIALIPALAEEFAFRGIVLGSLRKYSEALAVFVSAALFGLMHGNFIQIPFAFCGGLVFGFVAVKCNSLLPGIIIHFLNNALSVTFDLMSNAVSETFSNIVYFSISAALCALSFIFIRKLIKTRPDIFSFKGSDKGIPYKLKVKTVFTSPTIIVYIVYMIIYTLIAEFMI